MSLKAILFISIFTAVGSTFFIHLANAAGRPATVSNTAFEIGIKIIIMFFGQWGLDRLIARYLRKKPVN